MHPSRPGMAESRAVRPLTRRGAPSSSRSAHAMMKAMNDHIVGRSQLSLRVSRRAIAHVVRCMDARAMDERWIPFALGDAGLAAEQCRRYDFPEGEADSRLGAASFPPGEVLELGENFPDAGLLADADSSADLHLHRVAIWPDDRASVLGARMRHELEHAAQWERFGPGIFPPLQRRALGALGAGGGARRVRRHVHQRDPERAGRQRRLGDVPAPPPHAHDRRSLHDDRWRRLACSLIGPEHIETLPAQMVAYLWLFRGICLGVVEEEDRTFDRRSRPPTRAPARLAPPRLRPSPRRATWRRLDTHASPRRPRALPPAAFV